MEFFLGNIRGPQGLSGDSNTNYRVLNINKTEWTPFYKYYVDLSCKYYLLLDISKFSIPLAKSYWVFGQEANSNDIFEFDYEVNSFTGIITLYTSKVADYKIYIIYGKDDIITEVPVVEHNLKSIYGIDGLNKSEKCKRIKDSVKLTTSREWEFDFTKFHSDFETKAYPWNTITEEIFTVTDTNGVKYDNNFIKIPKFYHKFVENNDGSYQLLISGTKQDATWQTAFINGNNEIDYVLIGEEIAENKDKDFRSLSKRGSWSNDYYTTNGTIDSLRIKANQWNTLSNEQGYHLFDIWDYEILKILFLVEYATTRSKDVIPFESINKQVTKFQQTQTGVPVSGTFFEYELKTTYEESSSTTIKPISEYGYYETYNTSFLDIARPFSNLFVDGIMIDNLNNLIIDKDLRNYGKINSTTSVKIKNHPLTNIGSGLIKSIKPLVELPALDLPYSFAEDNGASFENFEKAIVEVEKPTTENEYSCCSLGNSNLYILDKFFLRYRGGMWDLNFSNSNTTLNYSRLCYKPIRGGQ